MDDTFDSDAYFEQVLKYARPWDETSLRTPTTDWLDWWRSRPVIDQISASARARGWVLTCRQLHELGLSKNDIRREVRRGSLWRPAHGVVSPVAVEDPDRFLTARRTHAVRAAASALLRSDHVVEGRSGAILHGLPTRFVPRVPELAGPQRAGRRGGVHSHAMRLWVTDTESWFGVPVTTVGRTLVDLARRNADDAIMAGDAALRAGLITPTGIQHALDGCGGWPGIRRAREVLALASPKAESPLESVTRLRLHDDGFPPPELQYAIGDYWVDLCWPSLRLILECDGLGKYADDALKDEKRRERFLRRDSRNWTIDRIVWADVDADWPETSAGLRVHFPLDRVTPRARG